MPADESAVCEHDGVILRCLVPTVPSLTRHAGLREANLGAAVLGLSLLRGEEIGEEYAVLI